jgi:hypothetical protein
MERLLSRRTAMSGAAAVLASGAQSEEAMTHIALLGDSVIDNKSYVGGGPDVAEQLRMIAPKRWTVTRLARDGAVVSGVTSQLADISEKTTHLVISAGGNDALQHSGVLDAPAASAAQVLSKLADIQDMFRQGYRRMLDAAENLKLPTAVCTVYEARFPEPRRRLAALALSVINDAITREAFSRGVDLLDLRVMFNEERDFANPIEQSVHGGMKLAGAIQRFVLAQAKARVHL